MGNLIYPEYFFGEINIPNTSKPEIADALNTFITRYEEELMLNLFGREMYDGIVSDPGSYDAIINGDKENGWRGLIYTMGTQFDKKYSLIAYYVYWFWMKDKVSWNSGVGVKRAKGDSVDTISPAIKMVNAWNIFSEQVMELISYMNVFSDVYPEWAPAPTFCLYDYSKVNDFDI